MWMDSPIRIRVFKVGNGIRIREKTRFWIGEKTWIRTRDKTQICPDSDLKHCENNKNCL